MRPHPRKRRPRPESLMQNLMRCVLHGTRRKTGSVRETSRTSSTHRLRAPCASEPAFRGRNLIRCVLHGTRRKISSVPGGWSTPGGQRPAPRTSPPGALRTRTYFCAACYRLWEISEMAVRPDSISSGVLKWEKLKRTTPLSAVPRALCMSGAQWAPGRVQMP